MHPLPFVWPYALVFWGVIVWAFSPEYRIVRDARKAAKRPDSADAGSIQVITIGGGLASFVAFYLAWTPLLRMPASRQIASFVVGTATVIAGSLLRRHCFRQLGTSFTGDVRAAADQRIVMTGAYSLLRHPSYSAGILMNVGIGLALGSWASTLLMIVATFLVYSYRIAVEERALVSAIGDPYREFMRGRRRLVPFIY
jgi:protein-S-isoprenylcysteine O-methyltransferase Ste14